MEGPQKRKTKSQRDQQKKELFKRKQRRGPFDWKEVNDLTLRTALGVCVLEGILISFGQAMGGNGVVVRIYQGDDRDFEFASNGEELTEILEQIIEAYSSSSEDPYEIWRRAGEGQVGS